LEYGGTIPCSGGVMLENEDGTVLHDLTFDALLKSVREKSLKQLLEILSM
jgi:V/A-type H+-transporting ATPase subunit E